MNKPRLEKLIVALEGADKRTFTMVHYATDAGCHTPACTIELEAAIRALKTGAEK